MQAVIISIRDHELEEITHEHFRLNMQVAYYLIAAPAADQLDDVAV